MRTNLCEQWLFVQFSLGISFGIFVASSCRFSFVQSSHRTFLGDPIAGLSSSRVARGVFGPSISIFKNLHSCRQMSWLERKLATSSSIRPIVHLASCAKSPICIEIVCQ